ncbi:hypothetical protein [Dysgonomonas reticulitermitis]
MEGSPQEWSEDFSSDHSCHDGAFFIVQSLMFRYHSRLDLSLNLYSSSVDY